MNQLKTLRLGGVLVVAVMLLAAGLARGQDPGAPTSGTPPPEASDTGGSLEKNLEDILQEPAAGEIYEYDPQGRRDPFRSLIGPKDARNKGVKPDGPPGFLIDEIDLQGIVGSRQGLGAMIKGPDNKGYALKVGDKVFDGEVIQITPDSVVFRQEVNDPTKIERFRQVVKQLASRDKKTQ